MMQSRTHTCGQLRIENAGERVTLVGWMENVRVVGNNFAFIVLRDFYGTTQIVVEYDRTAYEESDLIAERIGDAEVIVINKTPISKQTISFTYMNFINSSTRKLNGLQR